jgi:HTH-type transcriptional regulator/antitoxin HigA
MDIKAIRTEEDYREALSEIEALMQASAGTPEGEKLDILVALVEAYEKKHYPLDLPDPVETIKFEWSNNALR